MSLLRPMLSRRGRLVFAAAALLLVGTLLAAPNVSGAKAAVKQFIASITPAGGTGGTPGTWTEVVTNCGAPIVAPCTASSTIGLGTIRIAVPTEFRPVTVSITSPSGRNWTVSYDPATGNINAAAVTGSDKLQPAESVSITINGTPAACAPGTKTFTTAAWGSSSVPGTDPFQIKTPQPTVDVAASGSCLESGGQVTDPTTGQTETIDGDFTGHVNVTFGGPQPDCSGFGALGAQWQQYHLPSPVTITPAPDFQAGTQDKISTSDFPLPAGGGDSSWFLICFAVPQDGHTAFETRGGGTAVSQTVGGVPNFVGILASCADAPTPCVSEQFMTTGPGAPPWNPSTEKVHIAIRMDPGDPHKR